MNTSDKMKFPSMCRKLRVSKNLKQRQVADALGIRATSYGNVESLNRKALSLDRVHKIARFYSLSDEATAELVAAWEELPVSEYQQRLAVSYGKRKERRGKARNHDLLKASLLELATLLITSVDEPGELCTCEAPDLFADPPIEPVTCELCTALQLLGLSGGWTNREEVIENLAKAQEAMS